MYMFSIFNLFLYIYKMKSLKKLNSKKIMNKSLKWLTLDNVIGLLLAILILGEFKVEQDIREILQSPPGMMIALALLVIIFIFMNPIVGLLFLVYIYESVKNPQLEPVSYNNSSFSKNNILNSLNNAQKSSKADQVDLDIVNKMAPLTKKMENPNMIFAPSLDTSIPCENV